MDLKKKLRCIVNDIVSITANAEFHALVTEDSINLGRPVLLLTHLVHDIPDSQPLNLDLTCFYNLFRALQDAKTLLLALASTFDPTQDGTSNRVAFQFQFVTGNLEKSLGNIPYKQFGISMEVQEQVELARIQLKRGNERYGPVNSGKRSWRVSRPLVNDLELHMKNSEGNSSRSRFLDKAKITELPIAVSESMNVDIDIDSIRNLSNEFSEKSKKSDFVAIPEDFLCPISLELMRDPVILATGQTYERAQIKRWIDSGHVTCPKTQLKLQDFTLTPNCLVRSQIFHWHAKNNAEQPTTLLTGKIKKSDRSFSDVSGDIETIQSLVQILSSRSVNDRLIAVTKIRYLSESKNNRKLIARAGAIPFLVGLLTSDNVITQEHAVTSILNLSIYKENKELLMLAGAIPSIIQVLRYGTTEAQENAAATVFSLSLKNEYKIIIGEWAISALVELLETGRPKGKKYAATAICTLCRYQDNCRRAVSSGITRVLMKMLTDSSETIVDEALTIFSVLNRHEGILR